MRRETLSPSGKARVELIESALFPAFRRIMVKNKRVAPSGSSLYRQPLPSARERLLEYPMADETSPPLRLADTAVDQMNLVIRNADQLDAIVQATMKATPALSGATVAQAVSKATNIDTDALNPIFNALDNLDTLREQLGSTEEALDSVLRAFGKEKFPGFDEARPKIIAAVNAFNSDNPVSISIKARRLSRLYEKLFIEAEIITDARPVYNSDVSEVLEYVVGQCLVLTYHEDSGISGSHGHPRLHMAMDTDDIIALRDACDRAIKKGITIKADLGKKARMLGDDG